MDFVKSRICEHVYTNPDAEELKELLRYSLQMLNNIEDKLEQLQTEENKNV